MAVVIVNGMSTRNRRIRDKRRAAARQRGEPDDIGTLTNARTRPVRFAYTLSCTSCGYSDTDEMTEPSSAPIGAQVDITTSCACGGQAHGTACILDVLALPD